MSQPRPSLSFWPHGVLFAVLWSAGMAWWTEARDVFQIAILVAGGLAAGYLWVVVMRALKRRQRVGPR